MAVASKVGVCGAAGRMGRAIIRLLCAGPDAPATLGAAIEARGAAAVGQDAGVLAGGRPLEIMIRDQLPAVLNDCDVLINFTLAEAVPAVLGHCRQAGKPLVIGTTGLEPSTVKAVRDAARDIPIVLAPNMSVGVNLCLKLLAQAAEVVGEDADIEIIDLHHREKRDAPSGTALRMGEKIARVLGRDLEQSASYGRRGIGPTRSRDTIAFATLRAGDSVGEHTVLFALDGERIEITHRASSRETFARGAIRAACWLVHQVPGCYDMQDVLALR